MRAGYRRARRQETDGSASNLMAMAMLATLIALAVPTTIAPATPSYFGLNGSKLFHNIVDGKPEKSGPRFQWMRELGVRWDRIDLWWHVAEPEKGVWDFTKPDAAFREYERQGVQWYPILCYGANWFDTGRNSPRDPADFSDFANYVGKVVGRYKGRAPVWALWNEPNILPFWAPEPKVADYVRLMKLAYPAFKRADPNALLAAPVIAPIGPWDRGFTERMYQLGGNQFDIFDYHYYRSGPPEREVPAELAEIRAVMRRYDTVKPIWISEAGVSSALVSEEVQAALVVRHHLISLACGASKYFYFDLQNWQDDKPQQWDTQLGLVKADGTKKPAFQAYRTMVRMVDGREIVGRCAGWGGGVERVLLREPSTGRYTLAIWSNDGKPRQVGLDVLPKFYEVGADGIGAARTAEHGTAKVSVGRAPKYVVGVQGQSYLPLAGVRFDAQHVILAQGESAPLNVHIDREIDASSVRIVAGPGDGGVRWNARGGTVSVHRGAAAGRRAFRAAVLWRDGAGRQQRHDVTTTIEVIPTQSIALRPYLEGGKLMAAVTVSNGSKAATDGAVQVSWLETGSTLLAETRLRVPAMSTQIARLSIDRDLTAGIAREAVWEATYREQPSRGFRVYPMLDGRRIQVDGDFSDWAGIPTIYLGGPNQVVLGKAGWTPADASAHIAAARYRGKLYIKALVIDDDPLVNDEPGLTIWKGDSLEIFLGVKGPTRRTIIDKATEFQMGLAPIHRAGNPLAFLFHKDVPLNESGIAAQRTKDGWSLEAVIELEELQIDEPAFIANPILAFDVKLNDLDRDDWAPMGVKRGRELVWNGDGTNWINPSQWGLAVPLKKP